MCQGSSTEVALSKAVIFSVVAAGTGDESRGGVLDGMNTFRGADYLQHQWLGDLA